MYKTCPHCERTFRTRSSKTRFCSWECYDAWRKARASRSPKAKKARRARLLTQRVRGRISQAEFERKKRELGEQGLI